MAMLMAKKASYKMLMAMLFFTEWFTGEFTRKSTGGITVSRKVNIKRGWYSAVDSGFQRWFEQQMNINCTSNKQQIVYKKVAQ